MEKTVAMGDSLKGEGEEGEREKVDRRLETLSSRFAELKETANARMNGGGGGGGECTHRVCSSIQYTHTHTESH